MKFSFPNHPLVITLATVTFAGSFATSAFGDLVSEVECGDPNNNAVGPYDYTNSADRERADRIPIVERYHFSTKVETLEGGMSSVDVMADLDYTLRAVPNHHRALYAVGRYQIRTGAAAMKYRTAKCYFDRAIRFRPQDATVRMLFGIFLHKSDEHAAAEVQYRKAVEIDDSMAEAYYNLGLLYVEMSQPEKGLDAANMAYDLGFPLQGLKQRLVQSGHWKN